MTNPVCISPKEASEKLAEGWTYVDVRTREEFEAGHPPRAGNVPIMHAADGAMTPNPGFMSVMTVAVPKEAEIICGCKAGGRARGAPQMVLARGVTGILGP